MEREAAKAGASIARESAPGPAPRGPGHGAVHPAVALLGLRLSDPAEIVKRVGEGFSFHALERFQKATRIPTDDLAEVVAIKPRTLHRRKREGRLDPEESDRLLRVSRVFARALDLFEGDADAARRWFYAPARALGGERPIDFARTDLGSREIEALIDRLEQGVLTQVPTAWRLTKARYLATAWDGEGAKRAGGRWNSVGTAVVYASATLSLALVETLVHLPAGVLPAYAAQPVEFDEALLAVLGDADLPADWRAGPPPASTRAIGDEWVRAGRTAVLRVPSVVVPLECNYVFNPRHPDFARVSVGVPIAFPFDPRLATPGQEPCRPATSRHSRETEGEP